MTLAYPLPLLLCWHHISYGGTDTYEGFLYYHGGDLPSPHIPTTRDAGNMHGEGSAFLFRCSSVHYLRQSITHNHVLIGKEDKSQPH